MKKKTKIIAVTGCHGRLGSVLVNGYGCIPIDCDIMKPKLLAKEIEAILPDVVIHCASITAVDNVEDEQADRARAVNGTGVSYVREAFDGQMILLSTDYIFDGRRGPYSENAEPDPISFYGKTKEFGEFLFREYNFPTDVVVRTTILYGSKAKPDFVTKILDQLEKGRPFEVTNRVIGNPTYVPHLAEAIIYLVKCIERPPKVINIVGKEWLSRYEFALMIADVWGYNKQLVIPTARNMGTAKRPGKAGLKTSLAERLGIPIYSVIDGLEDMKKRYKND